MKLKGLSKKYKITLIMIMMFIIVSVIVGISYALWQIIEYQTNSNIVESGCLKIKFEELSNSINLNNSYPISAIEASRLTPYKFKITNDCSLATNYYVTLNTINGANMIDEDLVRVSVLPYELFSSKFVLSDYEINIDTYGLEISNLKQSYIMDKGYLNPKETVTYDAYIWIDESATNAIAGHQFEASIDVIAVATAQLATIRQSSAGTSPLVASSTIKNSIRIIEFVDHVNVPENALASYDISANQDGSIMSWYIQSGTAGTSDGGVITAYKLFVGQVGGVVANQDSSNLFKDFKILNTINLEALDTSLVKNMNNMFSNVSSNYRFASTYNLDFDTSNVLTMRDMFTSTGSGSNSSNGLTINFGNQFNTSKVVNMQNMFASAGNYKTIINFNGNFKTDDVIDMRNMFHKFGKNSTMELDLRNFNFDNVIFASDMFTDFSVNKKIYVKNTVDADWLRNTGFTGTIVDCSSIVCS